MSNVTPGMDLESSLYLGSPLHPAAKMIFLLLAIGVFLSGVFGNILLLIVLASHRPLRQVHNIFIANLALADLLVVASGLPHLILELILGYHPLYNEWHCRAYGFLISVGFMVSMISLVGISLNRYLKVCHGNVYLKLFSVKKNTCICVSLWLVAFFLNLPSLVGWLPPFEYNPDVHACGSRGDGEADYVVSVIIVICVVAICYFNFIIFRRWSEVRRRLAVVAGHQRTAEIPRNTGTGNQKTTFQKNMVWVMISKWKRTETAQETDEDNGTDSSRTQNVRLSSETNDKTPESSQNLHASHLLAKSSSNARFPQRNRASDDAFAKDRDTNLDSKQSSCLPLSELQNVDSYRIDDANTEDVTLFVHKAIVEPIREGPASRKMTTDENPSFLWENGHAFSSNNEEQDRGHNFNHRAIVNDGKVPIREVHNTKAAKSEEILTLLREGVSAAEDCDQLLRERSLSTGSNEQDVRHCQNTQRAIAENREECASNGANNSSNITDNGVGENQIRNSPSARNSSVEEDCNESVTDRPFQLRALSDTRFPAGTRVSESAPSSGRVDKPVRDAPTFQRAIVKDTYKSGSAVALVKSLLVVSLVFVVLFVQFVAVSVASKVTDVSSEVMLGSSLILIANNAVNWIIYGVMNTSFRQAYKETLRCVKCRRT